MRILVLTENDACCGPMAAAFLNDYSVSTKAVSAGRNPVQKIDPLVVTVMKECLIDLNNYVPKNTKDILTTDFDAVYECPDLPCPETIEECRLLRDFIKNEAFLFYKLGKKEDQSIY